MRRESAENTPLTLPTRIGQNAPMKIKKIEDALKVGKSTREYGRYTVAGIGDTVFAIG
jgi:hypothetical protein